MEDPNSYLLRVKWCTSKELLTPIISGSILSSKTDRNGHRWLINLILLIILNKTCSIFTSFFFTQKNKQHQDILQPFGASPGRAAMMLTDHSLFGDSGEIAHQHTQIDRYCRIAVAAGAVSSTTLSPSACGGQKPLKRVQFPVHSCRFTTASQPPTKLRSLLRYVRLLRSDALRAYMIAFGLSGSKGNARAIRPFQWIPSIGAWINSEGDGRQWRETVSDTDAGWLWLAIFSKACSCGPPIISIQCRSYCIISGGVHWLFQILSEMILDWLRQIGSYLRLQF